MSEILYKEEAYAIVGICMNIHTELGHGFSEIVYKDALELELGAKEILFEREKEYLVHYKGVPLNHKFYADFIVFDKIIIEIKCAKGISDEHIAQTLNYLKASNNKLGMIINFGRDKFDYKRIIY